MDSTRIRFLLRALRPNGSDDADPTFRDALDKTHADPELGAWFARERNVDRVLAAKLREVRAPAELKAQILQGVALSKAPRSHHSLASYLAPLAAAASIALVIYTLAPRSHPPTVELQVIVSAAVDEAAQPPALEFTSDSAAAVRGWLEQQKAPVPQELPGRLADQATLGGATVDWQGVRCSRVTFRVAEFAAAGTAGSDVVQLYAVPRRSCSSEGVGSAPRIETRADASVALWRDATNFYVLIAHAPAADVQALLGPRATVAQAGTSEAARGFL